MADVQVAITRALVEAQRELPSQPVDEPRAQRREGGKPLPEALVDSRVGKLIVALASDQTPEGVERALAWFYGSGVEDEASPPQRPGELVDPRLLVAQALQACVDEAGLDEVRDKLAHYMGEGGWR